MSDIKQNLNLILCIFICVHSVDFLSWLIWGFLISFIWPLWIILGIKLEAFLMTALAWESRSMAATPDDPWLWWFENKLFCPMLLCIISFCSYFRQFSLFDEQFTGLLVTWLDSWVLRNWSLCWSLRMGITLASQGSFSSWLAVALFWGLTTSILLRKSLLCYERCSGNWNTPRAIFL